MQLELLQASQPSSEPVRRVTCCHCETANRQFGAKLARRDLARYRKRGPDATTRTLIDAVRRLPITGVTLLDIGSGIGVLTQELLAGPVVHATLVDESSAYQAVARDLASEQGTADRCTFVGGDFVEVQRTLPQTDLVTLDRVVCCYPDYMRILHAVADTEASWCGLSCPRDRWYVRAFVAVHNFFLWIRRSEFRFFVHPERRMWELLDKEGFRIRSESGTFAWKIVLLERDKHTRQT